MSRKRSSTKREPPEPVFFVDADLSDTHFHQILSAAGVRFERHDDHFAPGTDDLDWLEKAGTLDWIVLSHNKSLRYVSAQTERLFESNVRAIMLMGKARANPEGRRHPSPWIAKLYRPPDPSPNTPGEIRMWLTLQAWLKGR